MPVINLGSNAEVIKVKRPVVGYAYATDTKDSRLQLRIAANGERVYIQVDEEGNDVVLGKYMVIGRMQAIKKLDEKIEAMDAVDLVKIREAKNAQLAEEKAKADKEAEEKAKAEKRAEVEANRKKKLDAIKERDEKPKKAAEKKKAAPKGK